MLQRREGDEFLEIHGADETGARRCAVAWRSTRWIRVDGDDIRAGY